MTTFSTWVNKSMNKGPEYFSKLYRELDMDKYKLEKYKELFMLASFQGMYDADLAYSEIYLKCSQNVGSKESLLNCLDQEEKLLIRHPECFDQFIYRQNVLKAIAEIRFQVLTGALDHCYL
jgi:hypothetical protein